MAISQVDVSRYAPAYKVTINGSELAPGVAGTILTLSVDQELNKTNSFSIELQDDFTQGRLRLLEAEVFKVADAVTVSMGYSDNVVMLLNGKIQNISASFHTGSSPTMKVEGSDPAYEALAASGETRTFSEKRDSDIVQEIAQTVAQMKFDIDPTPTTSKVKTKAGGKSYLQFLTTLASDNGYSFYVGRTRIYFKKPPADPASVATLTWGKDVIRFEPQLNTTNAVSEVLVRGWDSMGKKMIEGRATAGEEYAANPAKRSASQVAKSAFGDVVKLITNQPVKSKEEAEKIAKGELNKAADTLLNATIETLGNPALTPGLWLSMEGFGKLFSGSYLIVKSTHAITTNGYRTLLETRRSAI